MKWREGDTGTYQFLKWCKGRKAGWSITVQQDGKGRWWAFALHQGGTVFNSYWVKMRDFASAAEGQAKMEAFALGHPDGWRPGVER